LNRKSPFSEVGQGGVMVGGDASWVNFHPDGVWQGVTVVATSVAPSCVDCAPRNQYANPPVSGSFLLFRRNIQKTLAEWQQDTCTQPCSPPKVMYTAGDVTVS
jgi:hypothetical protein